MRCTILPAFLLTLLITCCAPGYSRSVSVTSNASIIGNYELFQITLHVTDPGHGNPFHDANCSATFTPAQGNPTTVPGFCDSADGTCYRIRFCPTIPVDAARDATGHWRPFRYTFQGSFTDAQGSTPFTGSFTVLAGNNPGPVTANPEFPRHFIYAGTHRPYFHLGYTALFLLDPRHSDEEITRAIDTIAAEGFTKVRFLLTGQWAGNDITCGPLPAWAVSTGGIDYTRMNPAYWQRVDMAVSYLQDRNVVAECLLWGPRAEDYGKAELPVAIREQYARYAVARLSAYSNVWFNLGYEYDRQHPNFIGASYLRDLIHDADPFKRPVTVSAYDQFPWQEQRWVSAIEEQYFGDPKKVNQRAQELTEANVPYINEGYALPEMPGKKYASTNEVCRAHWAITLAGGYATYADGTSEAYLTGMPGQGAGPKALKQMRRLLETMPYWEMVGDNSLVDNSAYCLTNHDDLYLAYLTNGRPAQLRLPHTDFGSGNSAPTNTYVLSWLNPHTGKIEQTAMLHDATIVDLTPPNNDDWVALLAEQNRYAMIGRLLGNLGSPELK